LTRSDGSRATGRCKGFPGCGNRSVSFPWGGTSLATEINRNHGSQTNGKLLLATAAAIGLAAAAPANATLTYTIWNGNCGNPPGGTLFHTATFPVPTIDLLPPSFTDTNDTLNFRDPYLSAPRPSSPILTARTCWHRILPPLGCRSRH
jgi:hypothetical protein